MHMAGDGPVSAAHRRTAIMAACGAGLVALALTGAAQRRGAVPTARAEDAAHADEELLAWEPFQTPREWPGLGLGEYDVLTSLPPVIVGGKPLVPPDERWGEGSGLRVYDMLTSYPPVIVSSKPLIPMAAAPRDVALPPAFPFPEPMEEPALPAPPEALPKAP